MRRNELSNEAWEALKDKLPRQKGNRGKPTDDRLFLNAVLFVAKCGIPWRDLPPRFGNWNSVYVRFRRWAKAGVWQQLFDSFTDKEVKALLIDSTTVRAHQHAAGAQKKERHSSSR